VMVPRASQRPCESWVTTYQPHCTTASESQHIKTQKGYAGKECWPHLRVHSLSQGGPGGHCRYPEDRVPPRTSFKPRQRLPPPGSGQLRGRHVSPWLGLSLPARGSSWAATCPRGSDSRFRLGAAPGPPRVLAVRAPPPGSGQLQGHHVSWGSAGCRQINKYPLPTRPS
jgi:hypothetical protein